MWRDISYLPLVGTYRRFTASIVSVISVNVWNHSNSEKTYEKIVQCQVDLSGGVSVLDFLASMIIMPLNGLAIIVIQFGNFKMRESLCELSVHLNRNTDKSLGILFLVVFGLSFPPLVTFSWFSGWFIQECYTPKWTVIAPTIAFNGLSLLFGNIPLLVFFALALECFAGLSSEITQVNALLRSLLSFNFFWMLTNSSIEILFLLYLV